MSERLQKLLARAGVDSRRKSEEYIVQGRVTVNGEVITKLGTKVEPDADIRLDGERIRTTTPLYMAVNKPRGFVCSSRSEQGRPPVMDLVPHVAQRLFCVGRLDVDSCGLVLLTNDGELTERLTHPRFEVPKIYEVTVRGTITDEVARQLRRGVRLAEGRVRCDRLAVKRAGKTSSTLIIEIHQGINREIRRVMAKVGLPVSELKRIAIGPLRLGKLKPGQHRKLTQSEVQKLHLASSEKEVKRSSRRRPKTPKASTRTRTRTRAKTRPTRRK